MHLHASSYSDPAHDVCKAASWLSADARWPLSWCGNNGGRECIEGPS